MVRFSESVPDVLDSFIAADDCWVNEADDADNDEVNCDPDLVCNEISSDCYSLSAYRIAS